MQRFKQKKIILLTLGLFTPIFFSTSKVNAGTFGAEIFCTMRDGGNDHESSWDAAYTYIKKQKGGIFKVSPKQAAAQITESVIRDRETFSFCVEYLDKLHPNRKLIRDLEKEEEKKEKEAKTPIAIDKTLYLTFFLDHIDNAIIKDIKIIKREKNQFSMSIIILQLNFFLNY